MEYSTYILALGFFGGLYMQQFWTEDNFSKISLTSMNFLRTLMNPEGKNKVISRVRMENTIYILAFKFLIAIHTFPFTVHRYIGTSEHRYCLLGIGTDCRKIKNQAFSIVTL